MKKLNKTINIDVLSNELDEALTERFSLMESQANHLIEIERMGVNRSARMAQLDREIRENARAVDGFLRKLEKSRQFGESMNRIWSRLLDEIQEWESNVGSSGWQIGQIFEGSLDFDDCEAIDLDEIDDMDGDPHFSKLKKRQLRKLRQWQKVVARHCA